MNLESYKNLPYNLKEEEIHKEKKFLYEYASKISLLDKEKIEEEDLDSEEELKM